MLDDSNHHHQHAVLAPDYDGSTDSSIRFSSTHRLLRVGHTVQHVLDRCETACSNFHRNGPKRWRSEQGLLNEIEFEWLRQFFIQGSENKRLLWGYWQGPILKLFEFWEKLETRTRQVVLLLQRASEHRCGLSAPEVSSKAQRTNRIKAMEAVHDIMGNQNAKGPLYDSLSTILEERSKKRELWLQREHDPVFKGMPRGCRPILFPVTFRGDSRDKDEHVFASSPMPSGDVSKHIAACGIAYEKQQRKFLPTKDLFG
jgi:alpha-ketoglutarate-dependent dioxygenase FTO